MAGGKGSASIKIALQGDDEVLRVFNDLRPSRQRSALRAAGNKSATLVKRTAKRLAPVGHGKTPRGQERKHLRESLIHNTQTFRNGNVSTVVGADIRTASQINFMGGAKGFRLTVKKKSLLSNILTAPNKWGPVRFFGKAVDIPARKANRFLFDALEANKAAIEAVYADTIRSLVQKVMG